ncbi:MAG TPA: DUF3572 domain-containing protein [Rhizomicrobium sp.]|jgi:hypothetical protein|nr:DUF3572 domain-containing protein [Rhizomicrobium sp.]
MGISPDPELLALKALGYLAETPDALARFLNSSGATPADLRAQADDPQFLAGILDFLLADDEMARQFCADHGFDAQSLHVARRRLSNSAAR